MNKKGFTTIELILTILLVAIIMATITNVTYTYRDRSEYEETLSEVTDYKNTLTKIIYDDILDKTDPVVRITKIDNYNYSLITASNVQIPLIINDDTRNPKNVGIIYNGVKYLVPGTNNDLVTLDIDNVSYYEDNVSNMYSLDIVFRHRNLSDIFKIHFAIT